MQPILTTRSLNIIIMDDRLVCLFNNHSKHSLVSNKNIYLYPKNVFFWLITETWMENTVDFKGKISSLLLALLQPVHILLLNNSLLKADAIIANITSSYNLYGTSTIKKIIFHCLPDIINKRILSISPYWFQSSRKRLIHWPCTLITHICSITKVRNTYQKKNICI